MKTTTEIKIFWIVLICILIFGGCLECQGQLNIGYQCKVLNIADHGIAVAYHHKSGFQMGVTAFQESERLERLKSSNYTEAFFKFPVSKMWKGSTIITGASYRPGKHESMSFEIGLNQILYKGFAVNAMAMCLNQEIGMQSGFRFGIGYNLNVK